MDANIPEREVIITHSLMSTNLTVYIFRSDGSEIKIKVNGDLKSNKPLEQYEIDAVFKYLKNTVL